MQAKYQAIPGPGRCHSKGQLVRAYLLERHGVCVDSIEHSTRILGKLVGLEDSRAQRMSVPCLASR